MNIAALTFGLLAYNLVKAMILFETGATVPEFPDPPSFEFDTTFDFVAVGGVDAVADAIQNLVEVFRVVGAALLSTIVFLGDLTIFVFGVIGFLFEITFSTIEGAPSYINVLVVSTPIVVVLIIVYKLLRSGESSV